jgi:hypothetical protein
MIGGRSLAAILYVTRMTVSGMRSVLVLLSIYVSVPLTAQDRLTLDRDSVMFPIESSIRASNETETVITLDSVGVRFLGPRAWFIEVATNDTAFNLHDLSPAYDSTASIRLPVEPAQGVYLNLIGIDPCIVCKRDGWNPYRDTLLVYSGGSAHPGKVVLDATNWVGLERPDDATAKARNLNVFPTPADRIVSIEAAADEAWQGVLYDQLGREVTRMEYGAARLRTIDVSALSAGVYYLRAWSGSHIHTRSVVVAH